MAGGESGGDAMGADPQLLQLQPDASATRKESCLPLPSGVVVGEGWQGVPLVVGG